MHKLTTGILAGLLCCAAFECAAMDPEPSVSQDSDEGSTLTTSFSISALLAKTNDLPQARVFEVGEGQRYTRIQDALDDIDDDSVPSEIRIHPGTYAGPVVVRRNNVTLAGAGRRSCLIEAAVPAHWHLVPSAVVDVQASSVTLSNLTVRNTATNAWQRAAVRVGNGVATGRISNFRGSDCHFISTQDTFWMQESVSDSLVEHCVIEGTTDVACNSGERNTFRDCHVIGNGTWAAFWIGQTAGGASSTMIQNCRVENVGYGMILLKGATTVSGLTNIGDAVPLFLADSQNTGALLGFAGIENFEAGMRNGTPVTEIALGIATDGAGVMVAAGDEDDDSEFVFRDDDSETTATGLQNDMIVGDDESDT